MWHGNIPSADYAALARQLNPDQFKAAEWIGLAKMAGMKYVVVTAKQLLVALPPEGIGCLYLDKNNNPVTPDASAAGFRKLIRHVGCVRGAWPQVSPYLEERD